MKLPKILLQKKVLIPLILVILLVASELVIGQINSAYPPLYPQIEITSSKNFTDDSTTITGNVISDCDYCELKLLINNEEIFLNTDGSFEKQLENLTQNSYKYQMVAQSYAGFRNSKYVASRQTLEISREITPLEFSDISKNKQNTIEFNFTGKVGTKFKVYSEGIGTKEGVIDESGTLKISMSFPNEYTNYSTEYRFKASLSGYANYEKTLTIRNENYDSARIRAEKEAAELAEQRAWERSRAGQICKSHSEWSREDCEDLANNKIWIGMDIDMVKATRGNPNSVNVSNYGNGNEYQWCWWYYAPSCFYGEANGIVTSYN